MLCCSYCGQRYPDNYKTYTCHVCGGLIESYRVTAGRLSARTYLINEVWYDWREKMLSAPSRPCRESDWLEVCAHFNGCAFCGSPDIDHQHLFVSPRYGGKYYAYNVVPICRTCFTDMRKGSKLNPIAAYMDIPCVDEEKLDSIMAYLETKMLRAVFEEFDFDNDTIDIVCRCTEDTDNVPFDGIRARRRFDYPTKIDVEGWNWAEDNMTIRTREELVGVTWRLLDDDGYEELVSSNRESNA